MRKPKNQAAAARAAHQDYIACCRQQLERLEAKLVRRAANEKPDFGDVGDVQHLANELMNLVEFLR